MLSADRNFVGCPNAKFIEGYNGSNVGAKDISYDISRYGEVVLFAASISMSCSAGLAWMVSNCH